MRLHISRVESQRFVERLERLITRFDEREAEPEQMVGVRVSFARLDRGREEQRRPAIVARGKALARNANEVRRGF